MSHCKFTSIHVWGGLGSQFFALMYLLKMKNLYPNRDFRIVVHEDKYFPFKFHRNGDTDLDDLSLDFATECVFDFSAEYSVGNEIDNSLKRKLASLRSNAVRRIVSFYPDLSDSPFLPGFRIRSISGHYTNLKYELEDFSQLERLIGINEIKPSKEMVIHFRQGDLKFVGKNSVNQSILLSKVKQEILSNLGCERVLVISESSAEDFLSHLKQLQINATIMSTELTAVQVIKLGVAASTFIGGESKLSFWIALFRGMSGSERKTYLPTSLKKFFNDCAPRSLATEPSYY